MKHYLLSVALLLLFFGGTYAETPNFSWVGYGNEPTGGTGGKEYEVSTFADLQKYANSTETCIIKVKGRIYNGEKGGKVTLKSNKSIIGIGADAMLDGVGLEVKKVNNIIIQNMTLTMTGFTYRGDSTGTEESAIWDYDGDEGRPQIKLNDGDCIHIEQSTNVWVDHCELYNEDPAKQPNQDLYDGLIDVKTKSQYVTVSWCYIHDHHKCSLVGSSSSDAYDWKMTYHHNYYKNIKARTPSYRGGTGHFFNNRWVKCGEGINAREASKVYAENNDFSGVFTSSRRVYCADTSNKGVWTIVGNIGVDDESSSSAIKPVYSYSAVLHDASAVDGVVKTWAGVGKLDGGGSSLSSTSEDKGRIIATNYYSIDGTAITSSNFRGLLIKKVVYENGEIDSEKIIAK